MTRGARPQIDVQIRLDRDRIREVKGTGIDRVDIAPDEELSTFAQLGPARERRGGRRTDYPQVRPKLEPAVVVVDNDILVGEQTDVERERIEQLGRRGGITGTRR